MWTPGSTRLMMGYPTKKVPAVAIANLSRPRTTRSSKLPTTKPSRIQRQTAPMEAPNEAVAAEIKSSVVADNNVDDEVS